MASVLAASSDFWFVPSGLLWAFLAALNYWVWRRSKSSGHLVMLLGAAWLAQYYVLVAFDICLIGFGNLGLAVVLGSVLFAIGFYLSVRPLVADDLAHVRRWIRGKLSKGGAAPAAPASPMPSSTPYRPVVAGSVPLPPPSLSASRDQPGRPPGDLDLR